MRQSKDTKNENATNGSFYNTINEQGETLKQSQKKAKTQEELILQIFRDNYDYATDVGYCGHMTASHVWKWMKIHNSNILLTSVRRAITTLCNNGVLVKSTSMRMGLYGKPEHLYGLANFEF